MPPDAVRDNGPAMTYVSPSGDRRPVTTIELARMREEGEKIAMLTAYDATFAAVLDRCGVDNILVGDSLGNVIQGHPSTLPVTVEDVVYHTAAVARGATRPLLIADMPFGSYQESREAALRSAVRLMAAGAHMVKLEGGRVMADTVHFLVERGIPVCGHIGLTPQSVHRLGGYRVQGRGSDEAARLADDAASLEAAGAALLVLELVPSALAEEITRRAVSLATIGIGAGAGTHGQVLVLHDMLGIHTRRPPRFVRDFLADAGTVDGAVSAYVAAVKDGSFPTPAHSY